MRVVATAGHVDHGKSTLVRALTGTDPDRLDEEKRRGLTIDLGFAFSRTGAGNEIGFVDVPGHERFIRNMLAGVGTIDLALVVVAADEGWMPQTEEHVAILDLLDVRSAVVALTKMDRVDAAALDEVRRATATRLEDTSLRSSMIVPCDSTTGRGVEDVRRALEKLLVGSSSPVDHGRPRLWVDRVFSVRGSGTVVTGTLTDGSLTRGDAIEVDGFAGRVRRLDSAHREIEGAGPGERVAVNIAGIDAGTVSRGSVLVHPDEWWMTDQVDIRTDWRVEQPPRGLMTVHLGTGEHVSRVRDLGGGFARIRLARVLPLRPGDRVVIRDTGAGRTVGGGEILDIDPGPARTAPRRLALPVGARFLDASPWATPHDLVVRGGVARSDVDSFVRELVASGTAVKVGEWVVARSEADRVSTALEAELHAQGGAEASPSNARISDVAAAIGIAVPQLSAIIDADPDIVEERGTLRHVDAPTVFDDPDAVALLAALDAMPFSPPPPGDVINDQTLVGGLVAAGALVDVDGVVFSAAALDRAAELVSSAVLERGSLTVAEVRDLLGTTRKFVLPLLATFDREGVTRRRGDVRIAGPRVRRPAADDVS